MRRLSSALLAAGLTAAVAACASHAPPPRYFQPTAAQIGPEPNSYGEAVLPRHGLVIVQGDDLAYGVARGRSRLHINGAPDGQARITISETLRHAVPGIVVENRGYPGDTVAESALRWANAPTPDVAILCFGYGDMAAHTSIGDFNAVLTRLIVELHAKGAAVFVVVPPSSADPLTQSQLGPYMANADAVARANGAVSFYTDAAMTRIKAAHVKTDAQTAQVYQAIGADMAPYIRAVRAPPSPQTGQAGSGESRTVRVSPASPS